MAEQNKANAGLVIGVGAAIAAAVALLRQHKTAGPEPLPSDFIHLDEETMQLLIAIADQSGKIDDVINALETLGGGGGTGIVPNADTIRSFLVLCPAANTPYQLPECYIPDDMSIAIKANPANVGMIRIAPSPSDVVNPNQSYPMLPNEAITYRIKNAWDIWISGTVAGDSVCCTVEQRRR